MKYIYATIILLATVASAESQTVYSPMSWGISKNTSPYPFGTNINGTWYNFGTISSSGDWQIPTKNVSGAIWISNATQGGAL